MSDRCQRRCNLKGEGYSSNFTDIVLSNRGIDMKKNNVFLTILFTLLLPMSALADQAVQKEPLVCNFLFDRWVILNAPEVICAEQKPPIEQTTTEPKWKPWGRFD